MNVVLNILHFGDYDVKMHSSDRGVFGSSCHT